MAKAGNPPRGIQPSKSTGRPDSSAPMPGGRTHDPKLGAGIRPAVGATAAAAKAAGEACNRAFKEQHEAHARRGVAKVPATTRKRPGQGGL